MTFDVDHGLFKLKEMFVGAIYSTRCLDVLQSGGVRFLQTFTKMLVLIHCIAPIFYSIRSEDN